MVVDSRRKLLLSLSRSHSPSIHIHRLIKTQAEAISMSEVPVAL